MKAHGVKFDAARGIQAGGIGGEAEQARAARERVIMMSGLLYIGAESKLHQFRIVLE